MVVGGAAPVPVDEVAVELLQFGRLLRRQPEVRVLDRRHVPPLLRLIALVREPHGDVGAQSVEHRVHHGAGRGRRHLVRHGVDAPAAAPRPPRPLPAVGRVRRPLDEPPLLQSAQVITHGARGDAGRLRALGRRQLRSVGEGVQDGEPRWMGERLDGLRVGEHPFAVDRSGRLLRRRLASLRSHGPRLLDQQCMKEYFRNMSFTFRGRTALRVAVLGKAVSFFGDQVATVALLLRLQGAGGGAWAVAGLLMASLAPIALLSPVVGRLVDRCGSRALLVASGGLQAALCTALVFVSGTPGTLTLVGLHGAGQAVNGATWAALVPSLVPASELPGALGLGQAANTVGLITAPVVAGVLTASAGTRPAIALDALTFVAVAVAGLLMPNRRTAAGPGRRPGGLAVVRRDALLRTTVSLLGLFVMLGSMVNVVEVFLVRETLGADAVWYGLVGASYAFGL